MAWLQTDSLPAAKHNHSFTGNQCCYRFGLSRHCAPEDVLNLIEKLPRGWRLEAVLHSLVTSNRNY
jgi:hypothetical protein